MENMSGHFLYSNIFFVNELHPFWLFGSYGLNKSA